MKRTIQLVLLSCCLWMLSGCAIIELVTLPVRILVENDKQDEKTPEKKSSQVAIGAPSNYEISPLEVAYSTKDSIVFIERDRK